MDREGVKTLLEKKQGRPCTDVELRIIHSLTVRDCIRVWEGIAFTEDGPFDLSKFVNMQEDDEDIATVTPQRKKILTDIRKLRQGIDRLGTKDPKDGYKKTTFRQLREDGTLKGFLDSVAGTCRLARKEGLVFFESRDLIIGKHDDVKILFIDVDKDPTDIVVGKKPGAGGPPAAAKPAGGAPVGRGGIAKPAAAPISEQDVQKVVDAILRAGEARLGKTRLKFGALRAEFAGQDAWVASVCKEGKARGIIKCMVEDLQPDVHDSIYIEVAGTAGAAAPAAPAAPAPAAPPAAEPAPVPARDRAPSGGPKPAPAAAPVAEPPKPAPKKSRFDDDDDEDTPPKPAAKPAEKPKPAVEEPPKVVKAAVKEEPKPAEPQPEAKPKAAPAVGGGLAARIAAMEQAKKEAEARHQQYEEDKQKRRSKLFGSEDAEEEEAPVEKPRAIPGMAKGPPMVFGMPRPAAPKPEPERKPAEEAPAEDEGEEGKIKHVSRAKGPKRSARTTAAVLGGDEESSETKADPPAEPVKEKAPKEEPKEEAPAAKPKKNVFAESDEDAPPKKAEPAKAPEPPKPAPKKSRFDDSDDEDVAPKPAAKAAAAPEPAAPKPKPKKSVFDSDSD